MNILFAGTPAFSVPALRALIDSEHNLAAVYTQPDRPAGRGRKLQPSPVKELALSHDIAVEQPIHFKSEEALQSLSSYRPDLMVVVAYGLILPSTVLQSPRYGCINIHASLLPRWRGAAPIQRAILAGDRDTGISLMQMDAGLDTGDILSMTPCPIATDETAQTLHDKLAELGAQTLTDLLPRIVNGSLSPQPQNNALACYADKLAKQEGAIDWTQNASLIDRQIRAFNPWPVAYSPLENQPLRIWSATPHLKAHTLAPGSLTAEGQRLFVATGEQGMLEILELQPAGKRRMSAQAYLAAHSVHGKRLGQPLA